MAAVAVYFRGAIALKPVDVSVYDDRIEAT
jgi:hypothetical protein